LWPQAGGGVGQRRQKRKSQAEWQRRADRENDGDDYRNAENWPKGRER